MKRKPGARRHGMKKIVLVLLAAFLFILIFTVSCSSFSDIKRNYSGTNIGNQITGTYELLNGTQTKDIQVEAGQTIEFTYKSTVDKGSLTITVENTAQEKVANLQSGVDASEEVYADQTGKYRLVIKGENTQGSFDVKWEIK